MSSDLTPYSSLRKFRRRLIETGNQTSLDTDILKGLEVVHGVIRTDPRICAMPNGARATSEVFPDST